MLYILLHISFCKSPNDGKAESFVAPFASAQELLEAHSGSKHVQSLLEVSINWSTRTIWVKHDVASDAGP